MIALGIKTVETRSWPAPARLGDDWSRHIPTGAVLATAVLAGMARVAHIDPLTDHAGHDPNTEIGCAVGLARTPMVSMFRLIPGAIAAPAAGCGSSKSWLCFLGDMKPLPEALPAVGHQSFRYWDTYGG